MDGRIKSLISKLENEIKNCNVNLLKMFPVEKYLTFIEHYPKYAGYNYRSDEVERYCIAIAHNSDTNTLEVYHKLLVINLVSRAQNKFRQLDLPNEVKKYYSKDFNRIVSQVETSKNNKGYYVSTNDNFCKDLSISSLRLFPIGARKYELSIFPIKRCIRKGWGQFVKMLIYFVFVTRGIAPFLTGHYDTNDPDFIKEFKIEGQIFAYRIISEVMKLNPGIKGYYGINWINDPQIERISPRLSYIRYANIACGCKYFYLGANRSSIKNATMKSPTRRRLYDEGNYLPENYAFVFSRKQMIDWADQRRWYW